MFWLIIGEIIYIINQRMSLSNKPNEKQSSPTKILKWSALQALYVFGKTNNQGKVVYSQNNSRELDRMEKEIVKTFDNYLQLSLKL